MNNSVFDRVSVGRSFSYSTDMLSIFREGQEKKTVIEPGMTADELSEIISDRLIEIVRKDLSLVQEKKEEGRRRRKRNKKIKEKTKV